MLAGTAGAGLGLAGLTLVGCGSDDDDGGATATTEETREETAEPTEPSDETPAAGDDDDETPEATDGDIPTGGTVRASTDVGFDSLDPHATVAGGLVILPRVYNRLLTLAPASTEEIHYDLASSYEQPDDVTYLFELRDDVVIAANDFDVPERPMDADDIIANFDRNKADTTLNGHNYVAVDTASYGAAGPNQFEMVSSKVDGFFVEGLTFFHYAPRELIARNNLKQEAVGGGPFTVESFQEGQNVRIVRNPAYYDQPLPYIDAIELSIIPDRAARRTAFVSNQVDIYTPENTAEAEQLLGQVDGIHNAREVSQATTNLALQVRQGPFAHARVRQAIVRGIDRQDLINRLEGEGNGEIDALVWSYFQRYALPADEREGLQGYDPDEARAQLAAAGFADGLSVEFIYPTPVSDEFAPVLIQQMQQIGVELRQTPLDFATWLGRYQSGDFEFLLSPNLSYANPISHLAFHQTDGPSENGNFWTGFSDTAVDAAIDAIEAELDLDAQQALFLEAQRVIYEAGPAYIPLFSAYSNTLIYDYIKQYRQGEVPAVIWLTEFDTYIER
ncbi:MAG: ABC transporter substrate-binding protein [Dehalococcoidia bacterium]